jgi:hypothetical protein
MRLIGSSGFWTTPNILLDQRGAYARLGTETSREGTQAARRLWPVVVLSLPPREVGYEMGLGGSVCRGFTPAASVLSSFSKPVFPAQSSKTSTQKPADSVFGSTHSPGRTM